ncbi:hypothetical protein E5288_WYG011506 [Bos mutus]|uniref:Uncharacterized protein n=1 Tax=Bos mutus TaxID=72004 RepID=A0A6B0RI80_9CETA|nr:hypothetical protein [Bos mutus]
MLGYIPREDESVYPPQTQLVFTQIQRNGNTVFLLPPTGSWKQNARKILLLRTSEYYLVGLISTLLSEKSYKSPRITGPGTGYDKYI